MDERTTGLILRTRLLTETSLIIHWLTPDLGRMATVAKGARRPKSTFRGKLDLFYLADFSFGRSAKSELHNLREVMLKETHAALRTDLDRLQQAAYASALVEQTTETETPLPEIYGLMLGFLQHLVQHPAGTSTVYAFELKLLELLGMAPELDESRLSPGSRQLAQRFVELDWPSIARLRLSPAQSDEFRAFLHGFLIYHLEKIPRGRTEALHV